jgi:phage tail sheath protein FI
MPGVVISTAVRTGPSSATVRESSQLFVVGLAERGPVGEAVPVQSLTEFENIFGGYVAHSFLHPTVETFFEEGGTQVYVSRVAGADATTGELALENNDDDVLLLIKANGPGAWSTNVGVTVTTPGSAFAVIIHYNGEAVYNTGIVSSPAQAVGRINSSSVASRYVVAELGEGAGAPLVSQIPVDLTEEALSAGTEDLDGVDDAVLISGLGVFNDSLGAGAVAIPDGENATYLESVGGPATDYDGAIKTEFEVSAALIAHANANNRIAILHCGIADTPEFAIAKSDDLKVLEGLEHAAIYFPWVSIPTSTNGLSRTIPPDGYVAAKRALAHNQGGAHVPAAGLISNSRFVFGTVSDINKAVGDSLDLQNVNAIRIIQNSVRVYGARSLSIDTENFRYITTQEIINHVVVESQRTLEDLVFGVIDGRDTIFSAITSRLIAILAPLREQGALFQAFDANGKKVDNGYTVRCDSALNPVTQLAGGTVKAKVGVRTSSVGDKIEVDIIKSNLTSSVV